MCKVEPINILRIALYSPFLKNCLLHSQKCFAALDQSFAVLQQGKRDECLSSVSNATLLSVTMFGAASSLQNNELSTDLATMISLKASPDVHACVQAQGILAHKPGRLHHQFLWLCGSCLFLPLCCLQLHAGRAVEDGHAAS